uniref:Uncharacterized protein n=1 Tax=Actinobacteria phage HS02 TaxID=3056388 RepID=A0AA49X7T4_9VIRU|nr:MAG: hypothetical protein [Actinobacteria phage HS02]
MPNPTREDIIEAHKALTNLLKLASGTSTASAIFNEKIVRDALPPKPQPTMAEVEWDDDKHLLAEAEHPTWGKSIMLGPVKNGELSVLSEEEGRLDTHLAFSSNLTPTGKRYTLTEVQE